MRFSLKGLLIVVAAFACVFGYLRCYCNHLTHVETGENVQSVDWLPASATNISFYKSHSRTAYEFDIPESDFIDWAWWNLKPITKPVRVVRYYYFSSPDAPDATVTEGLHYVIERANGGGVWVAYDRKIGRAYYFACQR